ncbi:MAG: hypothetical protein ACPGYT_11460, partial [Nitrospirales bacterium]
MTRLQKTILVWVLIVLISPAPLSSHARTPHAFPSSSSLAEPNIQPFIHFVAKKKTVRVRKTSSSLIQNLRFHKYPDHTRLVIDLKGALHYRERKSDKSHQVVLELTNTRLSKRAYKTT